MKITRSLGFYLLACSALCALIAFESYQTKIQTGQEVARLLGLQFESVEIPIESKVAGFLCVSMGVAGIVCLLDFWKHKRHVKPIPDQSSS